MCTNTEIDAGSMEDIESGLHAAVQFGQIIERLLVSFAVHVFDHTCVHYMCRIAPWCLVRIFFVFIVLKVNTHIIFIIRFMMGALNGLFHSNVYVVPMYCRSIYNYYATRN